MAKRKTISAPNARDFVEGLRVGENLEEPYPPAVAVLKAMDKGDIDAALCRMFLLGREMGRHDAFVTESEHYSKLSGYLHQQCQFVLKILPDATREWKRMAGKRAQAKAKAAKLEKAIADCAGDFSYRNRVCAARKNGVSERALRENLKKRGMLPKRGTVE